MNLTKERIGSTADALAYYADCAIATYWDTLLTKKYSKADRRRHRSIAIGMVQAVIDFEPTHYHLPALTDRLASAVAEDKENA